MVGNMRMLGALPVYSQPLPACKSECWWRYLLSVLIKIPKDLWLLHSKPHLLFPAN